MKLQVSTRLLLVIIILLFPLVLTSCSSTLFKINIKTHYEKVIIEQQLDQKLLSRIRRISPISGVGICSENFSKYDFFFFAIYHLEIKLSPIAFQNNVEVPFPLEFRIIYPGKVITCNAHKIENNIATWDIKEGEELNIYLKTYHIRWDVIAVITVGIIFLTILILKKRATLLLLSYFNRFGRYE